MSTTIILYGQSLLLDSVEASLRGEGHKAILRLSDEHLPLHLGNIKPGTIIYDHQHTRPEQVYSLLAFYPSWQLMGITTNEDLWMIRSEKENIHSLGEMVALIKNFSNEKSIFKKEMEPIRINDLS